MADIITSFFLAPLASSIASTQTRKLAPSVLELGSDRLTRNSARETLGRLFAQPSSGGFFASIESFLTAAKAGSEISTSITTSTAASALKFGASKNSFVDTPRVTAVRQPAKQQDNSQLIQDLFYQRDSAADQQLKTLLQASQSSSSSKTSTAGQAAETPASENAAPVVTRNIGLHVQEGGTTTLDKARLSATDSGTAAQDIVFKLDDGPQFGRLERVSKPGEAVTQFTQADLNSGLIRYVNDGSENVRDSFNFTVTDGAKETTGSFSIAITAVNDTPTITVNTGATADEGGAVSLTTAQLNATDPDNIVSQTVFEITSGPAHGQLEFDDDPGTAITSFTQADLAAGRVKYIHDGSETTTDSFTFRATDGTDASPPQSFNLTINPVDDPPELVTNDGGTVNEGGTATITAAQLNTTDVDTNAGNITYTVTSGPAHGQVNLNGSATTTFTQADLNAGLVSFTHDGSETTADSFDFTVSDGTTTLDTATFNFDVAPVDDAPVVQANTGVTVSEGGSAAITSAQLNVSDVDTDPANITFALTTDPAHGHVELNGDTVTSFTQADINAGSVSFVHDGSETTSDSFTFSVADETTTLAPVSFNITVNPVDDAPVAATNTGGTVNEGGTTTITAAQLNTTDVDTNAANITYTVTSAPAHGQVKLNGSATTTFTQADLNAGLVSFTHDGSETTSDSFSFTVSDGTTTLSASTFNLTVAPVDDAPVVQVNTGVTVNEGGSAAITSSQLDTTDVDTNAANITYTVTSAPSHGQVQLNGVNATSFTQADINAGNVSFLHDGSETTSDSFTFSVSDATTTLSSVSFSITVNPVDDAPVAVTNTGGTVNEGGATAITAAELNTSDVDTNAANITYNITSGPAHGQVQVNGSAATSFTQADVNAGNVSFIHDGSETTSDSFSFVVSDGTTTLAASTFNFSVTPVDDAPVTQTNTALTVTEGANATITSAKLNTTDVDTAAANITYTVTSAPAYGQVQLNGVNTTSFTQADVNAGNVRFVHDGSEATTDSFNFTVTDGTTTLGTAAFNINVTPVDDAPTAAANTGLTVNEGTSSTITSSQLNTTDVDTNPANITYTVTSAPAHGQVQLNGVNATSFTQADINANRVTFVHDGSETTSDSFNFTVTDGTTTLAAAAFNITVTPVNDAPAITNNGGAVVEGANATITAAQLHATDPDNTAAQLTYTVTSTNGGHVEKSGVTVTSFTQSDIDANTIRFVHAGGEAATAGFNFTLSDGAGSTQSGTFNLAVTPVDDAPVLTTNAGTTVAYHGSTIITSSKLDTSDVDTFASNLTYTITRNPRRGRLELTTNPGVAITSFTQADIDAGRLRYVHTNLLSTNDTFRFTVSDATTTLGVAIFNITVQ